MSKISKDHKGNVYRSISEMCRVYGISVNTYMSRRKSGRSLEETLVGNFKRDSSPNAIPCVDHKGIQYSSLAKMCAAYGISAPVFRARRKAGLSLEECLSTHGEKRGAPTPHQDHKGNIFPSKTEMCRSYNVQLPTFDHRISRGWTLEEALCGKPHKFASPCTDHLGNDFSSMRALCKHYGLSVDCFLQRRKKGASLEEALSNNCPTAYSCYDHDGIRFRNEKEMCLHYGIKQVTYRRRRKNGLSVKEALTQKNLRSIRCEDGFGNSFPSQRQMSLFYGIDPMTFRNDLAKGLSAREIILKRSKNISNVGNGGDAA